MLRGLAAAETGSRCSVIVLTVPDGSAFLCGNRVIILVLARIPYGVLLNFILIIFNVFVFIRVEHIRQHLSKNHLALLSANSMKKVCFRHKFFMNKV